MPGRIRGLVDDEGYVALRGRRGDRVENPTVREKVNFVVFDRWRGVAVTLIPLVVGALAALGFSMVKPSDKLNALERRVTSVEEQVSGIRDQAVTTDRKIDLLIRLRCRELTPGDLALLQKDFSCRAP